MTITTPLLLVIYHTVAKIDIAYICTKFGDFRFSRFSDMIGAKKIFSGSHDLTSDHAPIRDSLSSVFCEMHIQHVHQIWSHCDIAISLGERYFMTVPPVLTSFVGTAFPLDYTIGDATAVISNSKIAIYLQCPRDPCQNLKFFCTHTCNKIANINGKYFQFTTRCKGVS